MSDTELNLNTRRQDQQGTRGADRLATAATISITEDDVSRLKGLLGGVGSPKGRDFTKALTVFTFVLTAHLTLTGMLYHTALFREVGLNYFHYATTADMLLAGLASHVVTLTSVFIAVVTFATAYVLPWTFREVPQSKGWEKLGNLAFSAIFSVLLLFSAVVYVAGSWSHGIATARYATMAPDKRTELEKTQIGWLLHLDLRNNWAKLELRDAEEEPVQRLILGNAGGWLLTLTKENRFEFIKRGEIRMIQPE